MSSPPNTPCAPSPPPTDRGSALVSILLLAGVIALIAAHLLTRSAQEVKLATRSFYLNTAANLAEAGVEEAMWAANSSSFSGSHGWSAAADGSGAQAKVITTLPLAQGTGEIYLRVDGPAGASPVIHSLGIVRLPNQPPVLKQLHVKIQRRTPWANAIVAKGTVVFNGNSVSIDAYDSLHGPWSQASNRLDQATVATSLATNGGVSVNNADIYGFVATGGGTPVVGNNGSILGVTSPSDLPGNIDPGRVRRDFSYNIPDSTLPASTPTSLGAVTAGLTLPRAGDVPGAGGRYCYSATTIDLTNAPLVVDGPVDIVVSGNVSIGGSSGAIVINPGSTQSLAIYASADVSFSGNGALNSTNSPPQMALYGMRSQADAVAIGRQQFSLGGNASYVGLVYAPNADITLRGSGSAGSFSGAIVGHSVTLNGNYSLHYDIQLASILSDRYFRIISWIELADAPGSGAPLARDNRPPFDTLF